MTFTLRKHIPGRADINKAFSKENLQQVKELYVKQQHSKDGYHFADLSAIFCGLDKKERDAWDHEIAVFYPADVRDEIVRTIQAALLHKDGKGREDPVPVRFDWISGQPNSVSRGVRTTYDPVGPSYHIEIIGYPSPAASALVRRRKQKELQPDDDIEG